MNKLSYNAQGRFVYKFKSQFLNDKSELWIWRLSSLEPKFEDSSPIKVETIFHLSPNSVVSHVNFGRGILALVRREHREHSPPSVGYAVGYVDQVGRTFTLHRMRWWIAPKDDTFPGAIHLLRDKTDAPHVMVLFGKSTWISPLDDRFSYATKLAQSGGIVWEGVRLPSSLRPRIHDVDSFQVCFSDGKPRTFLVSPSCCVPVLQRVRLEVKPESSPILCRSVSWSGAQSLGVFLPKLCRFVSAPDGNRGAVLSSDSSVLFYLDRGLQLGVTRLAFETETLVQKCLRCVKESALPHLSLEQQFHNVLPMELFRALKKLNPLQINTPLK